jgi:hypothetical protein
MRVFVTAAFTASLAFATSAARADAPPPAQQEKPAQRDWSHAELEDLANEGDYKSMTLEVNPLGPLVGQWGAALEVVPLRHHALILSPYYFTTRTGIEPQNSFRGVGGEIGYRYYTGSAGPRGIFLGPSLLVGAYTAQGSATQPNAPDPPSIGFYNLGLAIDVGYQAVIDNFLIGIGAGAQTMYVTKTFPDQEWPSSVHTNSRIYPRMLLSFGYAFNP